MKATQPQDLETTDPNLGSPETTSAGPAARWQDVVATARDYYDSDDADRFYARIWGGEDIHVGIYDRDGISIVEASRQTVSKMADVAAAHLGNSGLALDLGSGYGGSARYLARSCGYRVDCLNLSARQNERNRALCRAAGLADQIAVIDGSFEAIPFPSSSYDVVWSQDAILHSARAAPFVLQEALRVLRPGGLLVFTDPMQADDCPPGVLDPVLARIHLASLGSVAFYRSSCTELGFSDFHFEDLSEHLVHHYSAVRRELVRQADDLVSQAPNPRSDGAAQAPNPRSDGAAQAPNPRSDGAAQAPEDTSTLSAAYVDTMKAGLSRWIEAGQSGYLRWGIMQARKPRR